MRKGTLGLLLATLVTGAAAAGCADSTFEVTRTGDDRPIVQLQTEIPQTSASASSAPAPSFFIQQSDGDNTLTIGRTWLVLRTAQLARATVEECPEPDPEAEAPDCAPFFIGSALVELPLVDDVSVLQTIFVDPGVYDRLSVDLHAPDSSNEEDQEFLSRNPAFDGVSVRVQGSYNGESFRLDLAPEEAMELFLASSLELAEGDQAVLNLQVDLRSWLVDADGSLIDPATAEPGGANHETVMQNIRESFSLVSL